MFIDSAVFICNFHRCQGKDGSPKRKNSYAVAKWDMICKLRRIAFSMIGEECDKAIDDLKRSDY